MTGFKAQFAEHRQAGPEKKRKVIFIAKGDGGLLLKRALGMMSFVESKEFVGLIKGFMFIGTPHKGTLSNGPSGLKRDLASNGTWTTARGDIWSNEDLAETHGKFIEFLGHSCSEGSRIILNANTPESWKRSSNCRDQSETIPVVNVFEEMDQFNPLNWRRRLLSKDARVSKKSASHSFSYFLSVEIPPPFYSLGTFGSRSNGYYLVKSALATLVRPRKEIGRDVKLHYIPRDRVKNFQPRGPGDGPPTTPQHLISDGDPGIWEMTLDERIKQKRLRNQQFKHIKRTPVVHIHSRRGGGGGSGKTQLVLDYIERKKHKYGTIIWIDETSAYTSRRDWMAAYRMLGIPDNNEITIKKNEIRNHRAMLDDKDRFSSAVRRWLSRQKSEDAAWLLVIDNAQLRPSDSGYDFGGQHIPHGANGLVLITANPPADYPIPNLDWWQVLKMGQAVHVGPFLPEESAKLIMSLYYQSTAVNATAGTLQRLEIQANQIASDPSLGLIHPSYFGALSPMIKKHFLSIDVLYEGNPGKALDAFYWKLKGHTDRCHKTGNEFVMDMSFYGWASSIREMSNIEWFTMQLMLRFKMDFFDYTFLLLVVARYASKQKGDLVFSASDWRCLFATKRGRWDSSCFEKTIKSLEEKALVQSVVRGSRRRVYMDPKVADVYTAFTRTDWKSDSESQRALNDLIDMTIGSVLVEPGRWTSADFPLADYWLQQRGKYGLESQKLRDVSGRGYFPFLSNVGKNLVERSSFIEGERYYEKAVQSAGEHGSSKNTTDSFFHKAQFDSLSLGALYIQLGEYHKAIAIIQAVMSNLKGIWNWRHRAELEAPLSRVIAEAYSHLEDYEMAYKYYKAAHEKFRARKDPNMHAAMLLGVMPMLEKLGRYKEFRKLYSKEETLQGQDGLFEGIPSSSGCSHQKSIDRVMLKLDEQFTHKINSGGVTLDILQAQLYLSEALLCANRLVPAYDSISFALTSLRRRIPDNFAHQQVLQALRIMGRIQGAAGQFRRAEKTLRDAELNAKRLYHERHYEVLVLRAERVALYVRQGKCEAARELKGKLLQVNLEQWKEAPLLDLEACDGLWKYRAKRALSMVLGLYEYSQKPVVWVIDCLIGLGVLFWLLCIALRKVPDMASDETSPLPGAAKSSSPGSKGDGIPGALWDNSVPEHTEAAVMEGHEEDTGNAGEDGR